MVMGRQHMKLSEFLAWWETFIKTHCEGIDATIKIPSEFPDLFVFRFCRVLTVDGTEKTLCMQRCETPELIESLNGLETLTGVLKEAVYKLKAQVAT
jgi:hypothetical protein